MADLAPGGEHDDELYHAAIPGDWERAQAAGAYEMSTRDRSLDDEGFIHCSYRHQVERVANACYGDVPDLVLLRIDRAALNVPVLDESLEAGVELFPHVYGPLPMHAVVAADRWDRQPDGRYHLER